MTDFGDDLAKITRHSEDNNILSPKNLLKEVRKDLSLNAQDDENVEMFAPPSERGKLSK